MPWLILLGLSAYFGYKHLKAATSAPAPAVSPAPAPEQGVTNVMPPPAPPADDGGAPAPSDGSGGGGGYADPGPGTATSAPTDTSAPPSPPAPALDPKKVANALASIMNATPAAAPPVQVMAAKLTTPQGFAAVDAPALAPSAPLTTTLGALAALKGKK